MKKIILIISLCICLCFVNVVNASGDIKIYVENNVVGEIGNSIETTNVSLRLEPSSEMKFVNVINGQDITDWFTNIPDNLSAKVLSVSNNVLVAQFYGDIDSGLSEGDTPIEVCIPYDSTTAFVQQNSIDYIADLDRVDNSKASYILSDPSFEIAYKGPYTISGKVGEDIGSQSIEIVINGGADEFLDGIEGISLPVINGLTPTVTKWDDSGMEITITYTGAPIKPSHELIHTTISKDYMDLGVLDRVVPDRIDVKFDINGVNNYAPPKTGVN